MAKKRSIKKEELQLFKRTWKTYVLPEWRLVLFSILLMIFVGGLEAKSVQMLEPIFDKVFIENNREVLNIIGIQILLIFAAKCISTYFLSIVNTKLGIKITKKMQLDLYRHLIYLDISYFDKNNSGTIMNSFNDIYAVRDSILNAFNALVKDSFTFIFLVVLMFIKNFEMALIMSILWPVAFYPIIRLSKLIKKSAMKQRDGISGLFSSLIQSFQGVRVVKAYAMEEAELKDVENKTEEIFGLEIKKSKYGSLLSPLMEFFGGVAMAGTLSYGGYKIMQGQLTTGEFIVFLLAIVAAYKPLRSLSNVNTTLQVGLGSMERLYEVLNEKPSIHYDSSKPKLDIKKCDIVVDNVSFSYRPDKPVLKNVSFVAEANKTTAIVGASGSGKSTLISLLLRFYDLNEGSIKIDGQDIREVDLKSLRDSLSYVSQDVILFDDTIKNNILFGSENATDEDVYRVAKNAAASNFIEKLDMKYDTVIGERGLTLSGGQRQMISIARAMLKNTPILLLDEATSALDARSEKIVQHSIEKLMEGKTTIVIAHRLSTIINADKIVVFDNGQIVEEGNHKTLLEKGGYYAKLYEMQFSSAADFSEDS